MQYSYAPDEYIKLVEEYLELEGMSFLPGDDKAYVIDKLMERSEKKRGIEDKANTIISEYVETYERNPERLQDEDADKLESFLMTIRETTVIGSGVNKNADAGIAIRLLRILKEHYRKKGYMDKYVTALYELQKGYVGLLARHSNLFAGSPYDEEVLSLENDLESLGQESKAAWYRAVANCGLASPKGLALEGKTLDYEKIGRIYGILKKYLDMVGEEYTLTMYVLNILGFFSGDVYYARVEGRTVDIEKIRSLISDMLSFVERHMAKEDFDRFPKEGFVNACLRARFCLGDITIEELLAGIDKCLEETEKKENPAAQVMGFSQLNYTYLVFMSRFSSLPKEEIIAISRARIEEYMPKVVGIARQLNSSFFNYNSMLFVAAGSHTAKFEDFAKVSLEMSVYSDKVLFIHTTMVREISCAIFDWMIEHNPEYFNGVAGHDMAYIKRHKDEMRELLSDCCMYHDIGKFFMLDIVENSMRRLTEDEFQLIMLHPQSFEDIYEYDLMEDERLHCIHDCALTHHLWHDGTRGYPAIPQTKNRPFSDILAIADSIDAATDYLGRPYNSGKTIDELTREFMAGAGTHYGRGAAEALSVPAVHDRIEYLITDGRKEIYYQIYAFNELREKT